MKPIVFDTVIDGKPFRFRVERNNIGMWKAWTYPNPTDGGMEDKTLIEAIEDTEEKAILELVYLLEK